jgi:hypothetical protein
LSFNVREIKIAIARDGGVAQIAQAMKKHPNHMEVQRQGCLSLGNCLIGHSLDIEKTLMSIAFNENALTALAQAVDSFPEVPEIQELGKLLISRSKAIPQGISELLLD